MSLQAIIFIVGFALCITLATVTLREFKQMSQRAERDDRPEPDEQPTIW